MYINSLDLKKYRIDVGYWFLRDEAPVRYELFAKADMRINYEYYAVIGFGLQGPL